MNTANVENKRTRRYGKRARFVMDVAPRQFAHVMPYGIVGRTVHGNSAWALMRTGTSQQAASYFVLKFHVLSKAIRCFAVGIRYEDNKSNQSIHPLCLDIPRHCHTHGQCLLPTVLNEGLTNLKVLIKNEKSEQLSRYGDQATGWTVRGSNPTRVRRVSLLQNH